MDDGRVLLDTNVLIALSLAGHADHEASRRWFDRVPDGAACMAVHAIAELCSNLTRARAGGAWLSAAEARGLLEQLGRTIQVLARTAEQTMNAIRGFASTGGAGPALYDRLIGEVAVVHGIAAVATWNVRHLRPLFPTLTVRSPADMLN